MSAPHTQGAAQHLQDDKPGAIVRYRARGMKPEAAELYRRDPREQWEKLDRNRVYLGESLSSSSRDCALVTRYEVGVSDTQLHSFDIQSPYLIQLLSKVFDGYPSIYTSLEDMKFSTPFYPFYHRWDDFLKAMEEKHDDVVMEHINLLIGDLDLDYLAGLDLNGRQIKNAVKTASLLAAKDKLPIGVGHINTVLKVDGALAD